MTPAKRGAGQMAARHRKHVYAVRLRRRPGVRPLLWLIIGFSLFTLLGCAWGLLLLNGRLASHNNFVGQLSPDSDPLVVSLPRGAILEEVHVPRNSRIRRGQTVATLDITAMKRTIAKLSAELLHDDMLRECLLLEQLPDLAYYVDLEEQAKDQARLARQDCQALLAEKSQIVDRLTEKQTLLRDEQILVTRYQKILSQGLQGALSPQQRDEDARQALALALLRNKLDQQMALAQFDADKHGAEWNVRRLERVRLLMESIRHKTELRHQMRSLLEQPRLHAPEDGLVVQVRNLPKDTPMREDIEFLVLRPEGGVGYRASFEVPHHRLDAVATGDRVQMTMLGMIDGGPLLTGAVTGLRSTGQTLVRAEVTLDPESVAELDNPQIGIALRGLGTASIIRVQKADQEAQPVLEDILTKGLLTPGVQWFVSRLLTPPVSADRPIMIEG